MSLIIKEGLEMDMYNNFGSDINFLEYCILLLQKEYTKVLIDEDSESCYSSLRLIQIIIEELDEYYYDSKDKNFIKSYLLKLRFNIMLFVQDRIVNQDVEDLIFISDINYIKTPLKRVIGEVN